ncbi:MAG TPA: DNA polymerase IV [Spirochaetota bacterium]|nr:DNA polymerase IV [Spirochaetota bacterium]
MDPIHYRTIVHVDMDAFYAAVEQLDHPEYRGHPVVVGADPRGGSGRGVVSTASYEARVFGVHSALPISTAYRRCPQAVFIQPRMERYSELSDVIMEVLGSFSPLVEPLSIDEAFLDCTGTERIFGPPEKLGAKIKSRIRERTGLTASVGIASCKSVAKIASDLQKPDGLTVCPFGREREFLAPLPVSRLWGAGKKTVEQLNSLGFHTVGDIANLSGAVMERRFGKWGLQLWHLANGVDQRPVSPDWTVKSISEETTYESDVADSAVIEETILDLSDRVARRARQGCAKGRTITLKIRLEGFETFTRSRTLDRAVSDMFSIRDTALELFRRFDRAGKRVRLAGVKISNLERAGGDECEQLELFPGGGQDEETQPRKEKIEEILDGLKDSFGRHVTRASLMKKDRP